MVAEGSDTPGLRDRIRRLTALVKARSSVEGSQDSPPTLGTLAPGPSGASASACASKPEPVPASAPLPPGLTGAGAGAGTGKSLPPLPPSLAAPPAPPAPVAVEKEPGRCSYQLESGVLLSESVLWKLQVRTRREEGGTGWGGGSLQHHCVR